MSRTAVANRSTPDMLAAPSLLLQAGLLVEAGQVDLLRVAHVQHVLQKGEVAEHVLVRHLDGERALRPDTFNCNISKNYNTIIVSILSLSHLFS